MKYLVIFLIVLLTAIPTFSQTLNIELGGTLKDSSQSKHALPIFQTSFLLPIDQPGEIFTGPYTLKFSAGKTSSKDYEISVDLFGLGPDYNTTTYKMELAPGDSLIIPPLPVKGNTTVKYAIKLLDDTSSIVSSEPAESDTMAWGISETIHYQTHWLKNSYADFLWNVKMGYLEVVYNRYRKSFELSEFDKIDFFLHPNPQTPNYLNPKTDYAINPHIRRIDLVFGHDIDVVTPRPAAEFLIYRHWGYGPRWMVAGFAGYYEDNFLQLRTIAKKLKTKEIAEDFSIETWVDSDTGRLVTAGFTKWLIDTKFNSKFRELYQKSTSFDYLIQFKAIYGFDFTKAIQEFIDYAKAYKPHQSELGYFADLYMKQQDFARANEYLKEATEIKGDTKSSPSLRQELIKCQYWLGDYKGAFQTIGPNPFNPSCDDVYRSANLDMAAGHFNDKVIAGEKPADPAYFYKTFSGLMIGPACPETSLRLASLYLDAGDIANAAPLLDSLDGKITSTPDYFLAVGRMRVMQGLHSDSILAMAAAIALSGTENEPQEPVNYLMVGQAFLLMHRYDKAKEYLDISLYLEKRPYFQGQMLLERGKLADLEGKRDEASEYYNHILTIKAGEYEKYLAQKYLERKFEIQSDSGN